MLWETGRIACEGGRVDPAQDVGGVDLSRDAGAMDPV